MSLVNGSFHTSDDPLNLEVNISFKQALQKHIVCDLVVFFILVIGKKKERKTREKCFCNRICLTFKKFYLGFHKIICFLDMIGAL